MGWICGTYVEERKYMGVFGGETTWKKQASMAEYEILF